MNHPAELKAQETNPELALDIVATYQGPVLVDLDETLYLRNSTEDFLDSAWPRLPANLLLRLLDVAKPWRWTGGTATRDVWRVGSILALLPWTRRLWRRRVQALAERHTNRPLREVLVALRDKPIIATIGFAPIVTPLLGAMGLGELRVVAARPWNCADRRRGKYAMVQEALGTATVARALVLTDSLEDAPLLRACARPLHTIWPDARYRRAFSGDYLPGQYLTFIKRPGEHYILRGIIQEDFAFWVLASLGLGPAPWILLPALALLLLSFWCIYERGYVDNDLIGAKHEAQPKLSAAFHSNPIADHAWAPWIWALLSGLAGVALLQGTAPMPLAITCAKWMALLVATAVCFRLYNRIDRTTRAWAYAVLQLARAAAFTVVVPVQAIGALALAAHVFSRWVPYYLYRIGGHHWPETKTQAMRLMFFLVLAALLAAAQGVDAFLNWSAGPLLAWTTYRAYREIRQIASAARRIDSDAPGSDAAPGSGAGPR